jgi:HSP20 family protein
MKATAQPEPPRTTARAESREYIAPDVNICETRDGYLLEADMPGVNKDGLEVTLEGHEITIVGHRAPENTPGQPLFRERRPLDFRRVFELDPAIDTARISARMNQGVLTLTLPKSERVKPRRIAVSD